MKYAQVPEVHSNRQALEAVLADIERREDVGPPTTSGTWSATPHGPTCRSPS
jgi:hypothetical protein